MPLGESGRKHERDLEKLAEISEENLVKGKWLLMLFTTYKKREYWLIPSRRRDEIEWLDNG
jgi:hypothetical protein